MPPAEHRGGRARVRPAAVETRHRLHISGGSSLPMHTPLCPRGCPVVVFRVLRNIFLINRQIYSNPFNESASIPCSRSVSCRPTTSPSPTAVRTKIETVRSSVIDKAAPPALLQLPSCFYCVKQCASSPLVFVHFHLCQGPLALKSWSLFCSWSLN